MLLSFLHLLTVLVAAKDVPQMEVLFHSSDEAVPWPPPVLQSGGQLAKHQPRRKVDVAYKKGFPSPSDFYSNFVERKRPVVFSEALADPQYDFLKLSNLNTSSRAALSFSSVSSFTSQEKQTESIRNFVSRRSKEPKYLSENLHKNLKARTVLPACLQCSYLADLLFDTTHNIMGHVYPLPVKQNDHDVLHCQIDGSKEILLVDSRVFPEVTKVLDINSPPYGKASFLNTLSVDYERYPSLAGVSLFHIALLGPGDCIYLPSEWIHQSNVVSEDNSLEWRWRPESWTPDEDCSRGYRKRMVSTLSFPGENYLGIEKTLDTEELLMVKLTNLLDTVLTPARDVDLNTLMEEMIRDDSITPDLQDWTEECSERLQEMFQTLDVTADGILNNEDLKAITKDSVRKFLGRMEDRFADLNDLIIDQRVDFSLGSLRARSRGDMVKEVRKTGERERGGREEL